MTVGGRIDAVGRAEIEIGVGDGAAPWHRAAAVQIDRKMLELQVNRGLDEAHIHPASFARRCSTHEQREDALGKLRSRHHVGDRKPRRHGRAAAVAAQPGDPGQRLDEQVLTRPVPPWSVGAIAADACIDEARVDRAHRIPAKADPVHDPRPEIMDENVRARDEPLHAIEVGRRFEVGGDAFLAAVDRVEERAVLVEMEVGERQPPARIAAVGTLDLDDPRAKVA